MPDETLNLALRRPQHYREQSQQLLHWLSRRWLYNIPRSLRTEGLRPLGRLALTDHARQTGQRIRRAVSQAVDAEAIGATERASRQQFRGDSVSVYVVASISGGTGSGMSIDVGYMVRAVLEKLNLKGASITGIMLHATGGDPRHTELLPRQRVRLAVGAASVSTAGVSVSRRRELRPACASAWSATVRSHLLSSFG